MYYIPQAAESILLGQVKVLLEGSDAANVLSKEN